MKKNLIVLGLLIMVVAVVFFTFKGVHALNNVIVSKKLEKLGFSEEAIVVIKDNDLGSLLINNKTYSVVLNEAFEEDDFFASAINIYASVEAENGYNSVAAINSLYKLKYNEVQIIKMFNKLNGADIDLIISYGYVSNINDYLDISIFKASKIERYINYSKENSGLNLDKIVAYVNIGLDNAFYTNVNEIEDPSNLLVLCNKYNKLPSNYEPENLVKISSKYSSGTKYLRKEANDAFTKMADKVESLDMHIYAASAYRNYSYQVNLYNNYAKADGVKEADTYSARAGHSEHQTGLAIDVSSPDGAFGYFIYTDEYKWVKDNAHLYGFIIRYEEGKEDITGYTAECWHLRYVGIDIATYIYNNKITYDEYYVMFLE